jgi:voltage-gated potassium channel Kch
MNIIDLLAVMPYFVGILADSEDGVGSLDILRLARICRVFKMARHHPGIRMLVDVLQRSGQPFLILVFFNVIICLLFASLMHIVEGQHYSVDSRLLTGDWGEPVRNEPLPTGAFVRRIWLNGDEEPTPFRSIPVAIWWVCVTLTTVGYGDMAPTTPAGKAIGVAAFYVGILFLALPISIIGSNFEVVYQKVTEAREERRRTLRASRAQIRPMHMIQVEADDISLAPTSTKVREFAWEDMTWLPNSVLRTSKTPLRKSLFTLLEQPSSCKIAKLYSVFIMIVILVVTGSLVCESMPEFNDTPPECDISRPTVEDCRPRPKQVFHVLEVIGICFFTLDYVGRVATVHTADPEECGVREGAHDGLRTTWYYCTQWMNIIDLLAILPFYVQLGIGEGGAGLAAIRVLRLTRIFRVLRMKKLSSGVNMFASVIDDSIPALSLLFFVTLLACVFFASCISFAEGSTYSVDSEWLHSHPYGLYVRPTADGYGTEPSKFTSITYSFWWFFVTATTVGYGDDFPTTTWGRCIGLVAVYVGIILLALPISVIGSSFGEKYSKWVKEIGNADPVTTSPRASPRASQNDSDDAEEIS